MKYILDGYNVIGALQHIQLSQSNKESTFLTWLMPFIHPKDHLVVVFDGKNDAFGFHQNERRNGMTIVTTQSDVSADEYIKDICVNGSSPMIVVTSDRDIQYAAKKSQVRCMTAHQFIHAYCQHANSEYRKQAPPITDGHIRYWLNEFGGD